ncbi:GLPGLI family protein [Prevotella aff. ruminicola Tc2-24]|uniref:GLPGLI family protein n=2 Tax=Prevotellaceae TaxID=171552 RepID=A0A1I0NIK3_9BACT|nr:GLPGLI family protein [Prevotella aff. ruminicola Tc2-24]
MVFCGMKRCYLLVIVCTVISGVFAQNRTIEPAILEVCYESWEEAHDDAYILRVGKTTNQFFSVYRNRTDSLLNTNETTLNMVWQEFQETDDKSADRSKRLKSSTINRELLYQDLTTGKLSLYSNYASAYNTYEEDIPTQEWTIDTDSTMTILGMECHYAKTKFRGREWKVWFTEEIPVSLGPWKLNGLPGLILKATADDDFIKLTAVSVKTEGIDPVTFYNWGKNNYYKMTREKFLKYKNRPRTIPYSDKVISAKPYIELE